MVQITLEAARVNAGFTKQEAAHKIGIHYQTLTKYENDSSNIPLGLFNKLCELYHMSTDNIFLGKKYDLNQISTTRKD